MPLYGRAAADRAGNFNNLFPHTGIAKELVRDSASRFVKSGDADAGREDLLHRVEAPCFTEVNVCEDCGTRPRIGHVGPEQDGPAQVGPAQARPAQARPTQVGPRSGRPRPGRPRSAWPRAGWPRAGWPRAGRSRAGRPRSGPPHSGRPPLRSAPSRSALSRLASSRLAPLRLARLSSGRIAEPLLCRHSFHAATPSLRIFKCSAFAISRGFAARECWDPPRRLRGCLPTGLLIIRFIRGVLDEFPGQTARMIRGRPPGRAVFMDFGRQSFKLPPDERERQGVSGRRGAR